MSQIDSDIRNLTISILKNREAVANLIEYLDIIHKKADENYTIAARLSVFEEGKRIHAARAFGYSLGIDSVKKMLENMIKN